MTAQNALLRVQHFYTSVPTASHGNGAAHLTNFALHNVTQRTKRMRDPRMRAIRHVSQLQSLWAGDINNYKWGGRQPVRRRRGDVHGDMTSVVLRVNWPGQSLSLCMHPQTDMCIYTYAYTHTAIFEACKPNISCTLFLI